MAGTIAFAGAEAGEWRVTRSETLIGADLPDVSHIRVTVVGETSEALPPIAGDVAWRLRGAISNLRYTTRGEAASLRSIQAPLGRPSASCAALIPIKKSQAWWDLAQDERRQIFEETSHHTTVGMGYLPAIARRLHHSRDLGEPFDFLTWFEFAPEHEPNFEALLKSLRSTREWDFVEREVDLRLSRTSI